MLFGVYLLVHFVELRLTLGCSAFGNVRETDLSPAREATLNNQPSTLDSYIGFATPFGLKPRGLSTIASMAK